MADANDLGESAGVGEVGAGDTGAIGGNRDGFRPERELGGLGDDRAVDAVATIASAADGMDFADLTLSALSLRVFSPRTLPCSASKRHASVLKSSTL